jgi:hypothetical protein
MKASEFDIADAKNLMRTHLELSHEHRKLNDENRSCGSGDRQQRLSGADGESLVCHGTLQ